MGFKSEVQNAFHDITAKGKNLIECKLLCGHGMHSQTVGRAPPSVSGAGRGRGLSCPQPRSHFDFDLESTASGS